MWVGLGGVDSVGLAGVGHGAVWAGAVVADLVAADAFLTDRLAYDGDLDQAAPVLRAGVVVLASEAPVAVRVDRRPSSPSYPYGRLLMCRPTPKSGRLPTSTAGCATSLIACRSAQELAMS